jgi:hypothetical protein
MLGALCLVAGGQAAQAQSEMTWRFQNDFKYKAQVKFFSADRRGMSWPGPDRAYVLDDRLTHAIRISCLGGEKICYGAWVPDSRLYWGGGRDNAQHCEDCCFRCQGQETPIILLK